MKYDDGIVIHTNLPLRKINDFGDSADVVVDCFQRTVNLKLDQRIFEREDRIQMTSVEKILIRYNRKDSDATLFFQSSVSTREYSTVVEIDYRGKSLNIREKTTEIDVDLSP